MSENIKNVSFYIVLDSKGNKEGLHKVYVRFLQERKKKEHFLGIRWYADKFDRSNEQLLPRFENDPDVLKHNLFLQEIKSRLNKISLAAYVKNKHVSIDEYISGITHYGSRSDLLLYMENTFREQYLKKIISYETHKKHKSVHGKLKKFFGGSLPMLYLDSKKIQELDADYRSKGYKPNTITSLHKVFAKYIRMAIDDGLIEKDPYDKLKYTYVPGERVVLKQDEVKKLYKAFDDQILDMIEHEVLRRFLFSCLTGLRISDTHRITSEHIQGDCIIFSPSKTRRTGKTVTIPLPAAAKKLIEGRKGKLFAPFADQSINRILKRIAKTCEVNERLSYHSARDTFGTIFIELGGDIKSLCDLMGHSSTKITEIYLKMADSRKVQLMNNFDKLF